ncbi:MAG: hypothetical protein M3142_00445, partial [Bacteroidota bacterium]|nr:hypothetical protein [Bacteroidota bacterium]
MAILHVCFRVPPRLNSSPTFKSKVTFRGVNWVAGDSVTVNQILALKQQNIEWMAQTPFGWQRKFNTPELHINTHVSKNYWGESDQGLIHTTRLAKQAGIKTLLKPHIWLRDREQAKWIGDIEMTSEADWQAWFKNYSAFILHYARLAEENQIEALCIGTELMKSAITREKDWRQMIREIRQVYHGQLTYAANWYLEYEKIKFWDALDFIGVQGYFPLTKKNNPSLTELQAGWKPYLADLKNIATKYQKPVVFTEVGYKSTSDAAIEPWKWPDREKTAEQYESYQTQANCYEALFQTLWQQPWFGGTFIWKWYPQVRDNGHDHRDFTPQH